MEKRFNKEINAEKVKKYTSIFIGIICITVLPIAVLEFIIYDIILGYWMDYSLKLVGMIIVLVKIFRLERIKDYTHFILGIVFVQNILLQFTFIYIAVFLHIRKKAMKYCKVENKNNKKLQKTVNEEYIDNRECLYKENYYE